MCSGKRECFSFYKIKHFPGLKTPEGKKKQSSCHDLRNSETWRFAGVPDFSVSTAGFAVSPVMEPCLLNTDVLHCSELLQNVEREIWGKIWAQIQGGFKLLELIWKTPVWTLTPPPRPPADQRLCRTHSLFNETIKSKPGLCHNFCVYIVPLIAKIFHSAVKITLFTRTCKK